MNILIAHNHYKIPGGEDTVVRNERAMLEAAGHKVVCYFRRNDETEHYGALRKLLLPFTSIYSFKTARDITELIRKERIDVVMVHNTLALISPSIYYAAEKCGVPVVQVVHNFRLICPKATLFRDGRVCEDCVKKGMGCALRHACYRGSRAATLACVVSAFIHRKKGIYGRLNYICLTEFNKDKLLRLKGVDPSKVFVKPNFAEYKGEIVAYAGRKDRFVFAGRLDETKGVMELLEAWKILEESAGAAGSADAGAGAGDGTGAVPQLLICGSGELKHECEVYIKQHGLSKVKLMGNMGHDDLIELMADSKGVIVPSKWYEGFPMVIAEAFATHTPVFGCDIGNVGELIRGAGNSGEYPVFTPLGGLVDITQIPAGIAELIRDRDRFLFHEEAFAEAATSFGREANLKKLEGILDRICGGVVE